MQHVAHVRKAAAVHDPAIVRPAAGPGVPGIVAQLAHRLRPAVISGLLGTIHLRSRTHNKFQRRRYHSYSRITQSRLDR